MSSQVVKTVILSLDSPVTFTFDGDTVTLPEVEFFVWKAPDGQKVFYDPASEDAADSSYLQAEKFGCVAKDKVYFFSRVNVQGDDFLEVLEAS